MKRALLTITTLVLTSGLLATTALAHAKYASSSPAAGSTVATAPASVTVIFTEDLAPGSTATVIGPTGATVSTGAAVNATTRTVLTVALTGGLQNGLYTVRWHSIAADDGDPLDGSFDFAVGVPVPSSATETPGTAPLALALLAFAAFLALVSVRALRAGKAWA